MRVAARVTRSPMGKIIINSLTIEQATNEQMGDLMRQISEILRDSERGGWMLVETDGAQNAIWISPACDIRMEYDVDESTDG
jgi:hypothetical protein